MNLKDFLPNKEKSPELFWSLVIEQGWVQAGIWYIGEPSAEVVSIGPGTVWETPDELIDAVDAALSSAVQKLPEHYTEPTKTVFGVTSSWVKDGEITEEKLTVIKKICADLSLTPVGFVVLSEAIAHLYKSEEGSPLSAIILGLGKDTLEISVFQMGNLVGTTQVAKSVSLIDDVKEGLTRFDGASPLPSRFVVYDGKGGELAEAKETLMQEVWEDSQGDASTKGVKFLHTPKAEILVTDRKVLATSLAGANEIGNVAFIKSNESPVEEIVAESVANDKDLTQETTSAEDLGFALGQDVTLNTPNVENVVQIPQPQAQRVMQQEAYGTQFNTESKASEYFQKTKNIFHNFSHKIFSRQNTPPTGKKPLIAFGAILGIILIAGFLSWWFLPKADVTIYASPKAFQQEVEVTFNTNGEFDPTKGIIPSQVVTSQVSGDKTKTTTGKKTIGDKAKGTVQIQNGTAFPINIQSSTFLVSSGNLKFAMDSSASVSAALSPTSPGTTVVSVTADLIGSGYNLAKGEVFKIGNYPKAEVDGTSTADFSGGSSQEIAAVGKEDQTALVTQLEDELTQKVKADLLGKVSEGSIFIDDLAGLNNISETFDHKIGDEASSLKLSLKVEAKAVMADKTKLLEYARGILKDKIPSGFVLRDSQIDFKFVFIDEEDGNFNYRLVVSANFLPEISTNNLIKQIAGKTSTVVEKYLTNIPGFTRASIVLKPQLPGFLGTLPHIHKNITIQITAEK
ncbi:MAG TPA: baseplate J/gp47 family protein [Patescibacteria group bacterium]|nr:baseplate J/gp47 family protein [Patescibacteria group bacterium]